MTASATFVIVGASLAGAKAAETLRLEGFTGRIILIGEEAERPYERPPLSKGYLAGASTTPAFVHGEDFYADHDVELRSSTRVTTVHPGAAEIQTGHGERIGYDRLLLATGARPRRLEVDGSTMDGIHYLRTVTDADDLHYALKSATRVAVVGGGWIGCEVAASARQLGVDVALVYPTSTPLERVLGSEVGAVYRDLHAEYGVELHPHSSVEGFVGVDTVEGVRTRAGEVVAADLVVVGVGADPRTELAAAAGLVVDNGIAVDACLQTSAPDIYAGGDVAAAWHPLLGRRLRVEHWSNALHQGEVAARNMLGKPTVYDRVPYFFSDQYDLGMEYAGYATAWDQVVMRGDPATGQFLAFWLGDGRVLAGMNANIWDVNDAIQSLVRSGKAVSAERLTDRAVPIDQLLAPS